MKKYLLTVFGEFKSREICREVALSVIPVVDSKNLKFQHNNGVLIFHFESIIEIKEIHDFFELTANDLFSSFILAEYNDNVSVSMSKENKEHLFNLDKDDEDEDMTIDLSKPVEDMFQDDDEFVALLLNKVKKELTLPTMDHLLDKINDKGIGSLSPFELGVLDNYSNNK